MEISNASQPLVPTTRCQTCETEDETVLPGGVCARCLLEEINREFWDPLALREGERVGPYTIVSLLSRGGSGVVFRAHQENPRREVAMKVLAPAGYDWKESRLRFFHETQLLAELDHPAILPLYDSGEDRGRPWFSMRLATGGSLHDRKGQYRGNWRAAAELVMHLADALQYVHQRGIIHRDLKPSNILFDDLEHPFVADFGLGRWTTPGHDAGLTLSQSVLGTPAYMAPEVAVKGTREATVLSDIYGLGTILYELLTGQAPFRGESAAAIMRDVLEVEPPPPRKIDPSVPKSLSVIAMKAMAKNPAHRYASATALSDDLHRWLNDRPIHARDVPVAERLWLWTRRHPVHAILSGALAAVIAISGGLLWSAFDKRNKALEETNTVREAAEERVDFMVTELPDRLEPLDRLDLLDSVFKNVLGYYNRYYPTAQLDKRSSQSLARYAHFLERSADVLWKQGQRTEPLTRLKQAVEITAKSLGVDPKYDTYLTANSVFLAYSDALREVDELDDADRYAAEGRALLARAREFSEQSENDDRLTFEEAVWDRRGMQSWIDDYNYEEAVKMGEQAAPIWRRLADDFPGRHGSDKRLMQRFREELLFFFTTWADALGGGDEVDSTERAINALRDNLKIAKKWYEREPNDAAVQMTYADACAYLGHRLITSGFANDAPGNQKVKELLGKNLEIMELLASKDPGNLHYLGESGLANGNYAMAEFAAKNYDQQHSYAQKALDKLETVDVTVKSIDDVLGADFLGQRSGILMLLGDAAQKRKSADDAANHFEAAADARLARLERRSGLWAEHQIFEGILERVHKELYMAQNGFRMKALCDRYAKQLDPTSPPPAEMDEDEARERAKDLAENRNWDWTRSALDLRRAVQLLAESDPAGVELADTAINLRLEFLSRSDAPPAALREGFGLVRAFVPVLPVVKDEKEEAVARVLYPADLRDLADRVLDLVDEVEAKDPRGRWRVTWGESAVKTVRDLDDQPLRKDLAGKAFQKIFQDADESLSEKAKKIRDELKRIAESSAEVQPD